MRRILVLLVLLAPCALLSACGNRGTPTRTGLKVVLTHGNNSRPYLPWPGEVAKQIAGDLEDVGFEVEIEMQPWSSYIPYVENGRHQLAILGWSADVPDTDNFLSALLHEDSAEIGSANNISFYRSAEVSDLLDQARLTHDETVRDDLYLEAQRLIFRDVPMVPLVYTDRMIAHRSDVRAARGGVGEPPAPPPRDEARRRRGRLPPRLGLEQARSRRRDRWRELEGHRTGLRDVDPIPARHDRDRALPRHLLGLERGPPDLDLPDPGGRRLSRRQRCSTPPRSSTPSSGCGIPSTASRSPMGNGRTGRGSSDSSRRSRSGPTRWRWCFAAGSPRRPSS